MEIAKYENNTWTYFEFTQNFILISLLFHGHISYVKVYLYLFSASEEDGNYLKILDIKILILIFFKQPHKIGQYEYNILLKY